MREWFTDDTALYHDDMLRVLPQLRENSVDSVICDPPYGLAELPPKRIEQALAAWLGGDRTHVPDGRGFMGKAWDKFVPPPGAWDEVFRVLKPGGYLLAFCAPRTQDLMGLSIRLAGFEVADSLHWIFGSGMPKGLNIGKAIASGGGRPEDIRRLAMGEDYEPSGRGRVNYDHGNGSVMNGSKANVDLPPEAARWDGWNTALKPSHEPVIMARKPLSEGTYAANVLKWGTGAINVAACKVGTESRPYIEPDRRKLDGCGVYEGAEDGSFTGSRAAGTTTEGRWPPNLLFTHAPGCRPAGTRTVTSNARVAKGTGMGYHGADGERGTWGEPGQPETVTAWDCAEGCPVKALDAQSGDKPPSRRKGCGPTPDDRDVYGAMGAARPQFGFTDSGGASRFFPQFAWSEEDALPFARYCAKAARKERPRTADGRSWPTVKPLAICRWLAKLVTPPGGVILDPFAGTAPVLAAARLEGFRSIGIELDPLAAELACIRLGLAWEEEPCSSGSPRTESCSSPPPGSR